jgi:hypothetical protein
MLTINMPTTASAAAAKELRAVMQGKVVVAGEEDYARLRSTRSHFLMEIGAAWEPNALSSLCTSAMGLQCVFADSAFRSAGRLSQLPHPRGS